jgi:hypothetical protein
MPAAYRAVRVSAPDTLVVRASSTLVTGKDSVDGLRYRVASAPPRLQLGEADRRAAAGARVPPELRRYTALPTDLPSVVAETARSVTEGLGDPISKATALRDYFRGGAFTYDPHVALGDDGAAVETFLQDRRGFCVQFASAYALMARSLGIPARVAVGFTSGTRDAATGAYAVTNHDAHAWPEIWLAGLGWTHLFDPTPTSDLPGGSDLSQEPPPVAPPNTAPTPPTTVASPVTAAPPTSVPSGSTPPTTGARGGGVQISTQAKSSSDGSGWPVVAVLVLLALVVGPLLAVVLWKRRRRSRRRAEPDPRQAIVGAWREAVDALSDHRIAAAESETPLELAARVTGDAGPGPGPPLQSLARAYTSARYSSMRPGTDQVRQAWHDVDELRRALDHQGGHWARVRARISLATLGRTREPVDEVV